jgi:hypothetical protein
MLASDRLVNHPPQILKKIFMKSKIDFTCFSSLFFVADGRAVLSATGAGPVTVIQSRSILSAMGAAGHWVEAMPLRYRLRWAQYVI